MVDLVATTHRTEDVNFLCGLICRALFSDHPLWCICLHNEDSYTVEQVIICLIGYQDFDPLPSGILVYAKVEVSKICHEGLLVAFL